MSSQTENGNSEDLDKYARLLYDAAIIGEGATLIAGDNVTVAAKDLSSGAGGFYP